MARSPSGERFKARLEAEAVKASHANNPKAVDTEFSGITVRPKYAGQLAYWNRNRKNLLGTKRLFNGKCNVKNQSAIASA